MIGIRVSIEELYSDFWSVPRPGFDERLGRSLSPRDPDMLESIFEELGVTEEDVVVDVGCRDGVHGCRIAKRTGCRVFAVDPIPLHLDAAIKRAAEEGVQDRVAILQGRMEELPLDDGSVTHIWCRDVLSQVDLPRGLGECGRVLRPGGAMLAYSSFATRLLEPREAARLYAALAIVPESMSEQRFEDAAAAVGFRLKQKERIGSEWRENGLENGWCFLDESLLRISRMGRLEEELVQEYGRAYYESAYCASLWNIYQVLGKLCPVIYTLERPS